MRKHISLVLIIMLLVTMISPMPNYAEEEWIDVFYILDNAVLTDSDVNLYSSNISVEFTVDGVKSSNSGPLSNYQKYYHTAFSNLSTTSVTIQIDDYSTNESYTKSISLDTAVGHQILTIGFDPGKSEEVITVDVAPVSVDVTFVNSDPSYQLRYSLDGSQLIGAYRAVEQGNYDLYYSKTSLVDEINTLEIITDKNITVDGTVPSINRSLPEVTKTFTTSIIAGDLNIGWDALYSEDLLIESLNGQGRITTNIGSIQRVVRGTVDNRYYEIKIYSIDDDVPVDLTQVVTTPTVKSDYQNWINLNEIFSYEDKNGHPVYLNNLNGGTYTITQNGQDVTQNLDRTFINVSSYSGPVTFKLSVPDLGIDVSREVNILSSGGGNPPANTSYDDYEVSLLNPVNHSPVEGVFTTYDGSRNQIYVYMPENTEAILDIKGVKDDASLSEILSVDFQSEGVSAHQYDTETKVFSAGGVQGGYNDWKFGYIQDGANVQVVIYSGMLGKLKLENVDSTEEVPKYFEGNVEYLTYYQFSDQDGSGSMSGGVVHEGTFLLPIQTEMVGVDYFCIVVSPEKGNSDIPQANTPFIEVSEKLGTITDGFIDLGTAKFQTPTLTGEVYNKNGEAQNTIMPYVTNQYTGSAYEMYNTYFVLASWPNAQNVKNSFYMAPLGEGFVDEIQLEIKTFDNSMKPISKTVDVNSGLNRFDEEKDQVMITMLAPDGQPMIEGNGLDRHIYLTHEYNSREVYVGSESSTTLAGLEEGETYSIYLTPDAGDFNHVKYWQSKTYTFTYTSTPGNYDAEAADETKQNYTVDQDGIMHLPLRLEYAQVYGQVFMNGAPYQGGAIRIEVYDIETGEYICGDYAISSGGYNGQPVMYGSINFGTDRILNGNYKVVVGDPRDTVYYSGTTRIVNFPLIEPLHIELPKSKVFGRVTLSEADEILYSDNISRVYVNLFDATGQFIRNALVRRDGVFSVGELADGKYFAKVFVSPFSTLSENYVSSKMKIFTVDQNSAEPINFNVPLVSVIGSGSVVTSTGAPASEVWVRIYDEMNREVEAVKTNSNGVFKVPTLSDGNYKAKAFNLNGDKDSRFEVFKVLNGSVVELDTLSLTTPQLMGSIKDEEGNLISDVNALVFDAHKNLISSTYVTNGYYDFGGLDTGTYYLQVRNNDQSTFVDTALLSFSYTTGEIIKDVVLKRVQTIGTVLKPDASPAASGWVHIFDGAEYLKSVPVDGEGRFYLEAFDEGLDISLEAEDSSGNYMPSEKTPLSTEAPLTLTLRNQSGLVATLMYNGEPLANALYYLYDAAGKPIYQTRTNAFGELVMNDLPLGNYTVVVPKESDYLIGNLSFTAEGQKINSLNMTWGE